MSGSVGLRGGDPPVRLERLVSGERLLLGERPSCAQECLSEGGCLRDAAALCLICAMLVGGVLIGISVSTADSGGQLGSVSAEVCEQPLSARSAPTCPTCTCCSNAATGPLAALRCPACVTCCAHCPRCAALPEHHANCLESGGKVEALKGRGRGWFCVPLDFELGSGRLPDWFSSVLDYNPQWRPCAPEALPTCAELACDAPLADSARSAAARPDEALPAASAHAALALGPREAPPPLDAATAVSAIAEGRPAVLGSGAEPEAPPAQPQAGVREPSARARRAASRNAA